MSASESVDPGDAEASQTALSRAVLAGRIDFLYRLGRFYLFFPFAALGMTVTLFRHTMPEIIVVTPLLLMIGATVTCFRLTRAYERRDPTSDPRLWARRYTILSAISGAFWGLGAVVWFVPDSFPAQAYLALAFLGMTAAEFIARAVHRPAYLAHATFSLLPLAAMLLLDGHGYANMTAVLVLFFGGVLYSYCSSFTHLIDESIRLRYDNAGLVTRLSREKVEAEKARDDAQASARAKSAFISNISHEIRTPLNALLGMAQLLERGPLEHAQHNHVKVILEAGRGLKTLLDDVIALSREDGEGTKSSWAECDAAYAARTVSRLLQPRAWEKKLLLSVTTPSNLPPVAGDPRRIRQLLLKLVENGLKFTETGGVDIAVSVEPDESGNRFVRFTIADTGHGIPAEVAKHLFEPFAAGDTSYARRYQGAGLGLAVAKRIVDSLGGKIGFDSTPTEGTTFWFTLPALTQSSGTVEPSTDATPPSNLNLLVFTADRSIRSEISKLLEPFGNSIVFASAPAEAAARADREHFDAIIVDGVQADVLGAGPGVKAPLLALLSAGERAPLCAHQVIRWPSQGETLYSALNEMLSHFGEHVHPEAASENHAPIDPGAFASLEKSVGLATLIEILHCYIATVEGLCVALDQASDESHWDEAARLAQDIAGAAGGLGLAALTATARSFVKKAREGRDPDTLQYAAHEVIDEHQRVRQALASLYPDLAA